MHKKLYHRSQNSSDRLLAVQIVRLYGKLLR